MFCGTLRSSASPIFLLNSRPVLYSASWCTCHTDPDRSGSQRRGLLAFRRSLTFVLPMQTKARCQGQGLRNGYQRVSLRAIEIITLRVCKLLEALAVTSARRKRLRSRRKKKEKTKENYLLFDDSDDRSRELKNFQTFPSSPAESDPV